MGFRLNRTVKAIQMSTNEYSNEYTIFNNKKVNHPNFFPNLQQLGIFPRDSLISSKPPW